MIKYIKMKSKSIQNPVNITQIKVQQKENILKFV